MLGVSSLRTHGWMSGTATKCPGASFFLSLLPVVGFITYEPSDPREAFVRVSAAVAGAAAHCELRGNMYTTDTNRAMRVREWDNEVSILFGVSRFCMWKTKIEGETHEDSVLGIVNEKGETITVDAQSENEDTAISANFKINQETRFRICTSVHDGAAATSSDIEASSDASVFDSTTTAQRRGRPSDNEKIVQELRTIALMALTRCSSAASSSSNDFHGVRLHGVLLGGPRGSCKTNVVVCVAQLLSRQNNVAAIFVRPFDALKHGTDAVEKRIDGIVEEEHTMRGIGNGSSKILLVIEDVDVLCRCLGEAKTLAFIDSLRLRKRASRVCFFATTSDAGLKTTFSHKVVEILGSSLNISHLGRSSERERFVRKYAKLWGVDASAKSAIATITRSRSCRDLIRTTRHFSVFSIANKKFGLFPSPQSRRAFMNAAFIVRNGAQESIGSSLVPHERWDNVGGYDEIKRRLTRLIQWQLVRPDDLKRLRVVPTRGVLLHGPSGCGKGLLARALAGECGVNFRVVRGTELFSKWFGGTEQRLRRVFAEARARAPCILFFDELDIIASGRNLSEDTPSGSGVAERLLSTLLNEMDGIGNSHQVDADNDIDDQKKIKDDLVVVIAATNRIDAIDAAALRPGRFDCVMRVPLPNEIQRRQILSVCTAHMPLASDVSLSLLASMSDGASGASLKEWTRRAAMSAMGRYDTVDGAGGGPRQEECTRDIRVSMENFSGYYHT
eukprot:g1743.t1